MLRKLNTRPPTVTRARWLPFGDVAPAIGDIEGKAAEPVSPEVKAVGAFADGAEAVALGDVAF